MHPVAECPHWKYEDHPNRAAVLKQETTRVLAEIRSGRITAAKLISDTRAIHLRLFKALAPSGREYLAGHYRGERFKCLQYCSVTIPRNPRVGVPPHAVSAEIQKWQRLSELVLKSLDALANDTSVSSEDRLLRMVSGACRIFSHWLMIHPYANGNGHIARILLTAILGRYGYWLQRFPIEPRPRDPAYSDAVAAHQRGNPKLLEDLVLDALM
jgi:fido (protein-threonine AMPylation protein)